MRSWTPPPSYPTCLWLGSNETVCKHLLKITKWHKIKHVIAVRTFCKIKVIVLVSVSKLKFTYHVQSIITLLVPFVFTRESCLLIQDIFISVTLVSRITIIQHFICFFNSMYFHFSLIHLSVHSSIYSGQVLPDCLPWARQCTCKSQMNEWRLGFHSRKTGSCDNINTLKDPDLVMM